MKLSVWAKEQGISYQAAWRMYRDGKLPVPAEQLPTGTIILKPPKEATTGVAVYARVSSPEQRPELDGQVARVVEFVTRKGWSVVRTVTEVGSGLDGQRPELMKVLADPSVAIVAVEHRDRLMRFGAEYVESALAAQGRRLVVVDPGETREDLGQDTMDALTSIFARMYGRRSARQRAEKALQAASEG
jgi:putative resolvase